MAQPNVQSLLDAGVQFTEMTKRQAEALAKKLVAQGEIQRQEAEQFVQTLVERGRETSEHIAAAVQAEYQKQSKLFAKRLDEVEGRLDALAKQARAATGKAAPAAKKAPAKKKAAAKKAPAKKKAAAKKAPAKKKAAAKKAPAKKAVGSSGVRKVSSSRSN